MKIMISQPMKGKSTEQIKEERQKVINMLKEQGHQVLDTIFTNIDPGNKEIDLALYYLAMSIDAMSKVDGVVFMQGWEKARGCKIEEQCAKEYGKFVMYL